MFTYGTLLGLAAYSRNTSFLYYFYKNLYEDKIPLLDERDHSLLGPFPHLTIKLNLNVPVNNFTYVDCETKCCAFCPAVWNLTVGQHIYTHIHAHKLQRGINYKTSGHFQSWRNVHHVREQLRNVDFKFGALDVCVTRLRTAIVKV